MGRRLRVVIVRPVTANLVFDVTPRLAACVRLKMVRSELEAWKILPDKAWWKTGNPYAVEEIRTEDLPAPERAGRTPPASCKSLRLRRWIPRCVHARRHKYLDFDMGVGGQIISRTSRSCAKRMSATYQQQFYSDPTERGLRYRKR